MPQDAFWALNAFKNAFAVGAPNPAVGAYSAPPDPLVGGEVARFLRASTVPPKDELFLATRQ